MNWRELLLKAKGLKFDTVNIAGVIGLVGVNADNISFDSVKAQVESLAHELQGVGDADSLFTCLIVGVLAWYNRGK